MPDQDVETPAADTNAAPKEVKQTPAPPGGDSKSTPGETGNADKNAGEQAPALESKPRKGEITADTGERYLAEIVALRGLSKVGEEIAKTIGAVKPGAILIVDDLSFAIQDICYLDLQGKLKALTKWTGDILDQCETYLSTHVLRPGPEDWGVKVQSEGETEGKTVGERILDTGVDISGISTILKATGDVIAGIGDIIGYFRTDYEIRGQTLATVEDLYIQALVAGKLRARGRDVHLLNFNFIKESKLIRELGDLVRKKNKLLTCAQTIKSAFVDGKEAQIRALQTHLAQLREKLIEYLVKTDKDLISTLTAEITQADNRLKDAYRQWVPDSQFTALETHLSALRAKLTDELVKTDPGIARIAVEAEIARIVKQLEDHAAGIKKLSDDMIKQLNEQLKLYNAQLVLLFTATSNTTIANLRAEIKTVLNLQKEVAKTRLPDAQISALQSHLAGLNGKLVECLLKNVTESKAGLEREINAVVLQIEEIQKELREPNGIVNNITTVNSAVEAFLTTIGSVPAGSTWPYLVSACVREYLDGENYKYYLKVKLMSAGADFIIEKPAILKHSSGSSYIGGGVVSYIMTEMDGNIAAAGTEAEVSILDHNYGNKPKRLNWSLH